MSYLKAVCGLTVIALMLSGCGGSSGSSSSPAASSSSGSGTTSSTPPVSTGSATLAWKAPTTNTNGSAVSDLAGYHIHYGTSAGSMTQTVDVPSTSTTSYVINNLSAGTWYFGITVYTNAGLESALSNIGSKTIT
jgi:hypothetical protein